MSAKKAKNTLEIAAIAIGTPTHWVFQHRDDIPNIASPNKLGLWGGRIEPEDASAEAAAIRELKEETGIVVEHLDFILKMEMTENKAENQTHRTFYFFSLFIDNADFEVFEGQGKVLVPRGEAWNRSPEMAKSLEELLPILNERFKITPQVLSYD